MEYFGLLTWEARGVGKDGEKGKKNNEESREEIGQEKEEKKGWWGEECRKIKGKIKGKLRGWRKNREAEL